MDTFDSDNGLLAPLADLDIPIPFADADPSSDDTPRASNREVMDVTTIDNFLLVADPTMVCDSQIVTKGSLLFARIDREPGSSR
jgi:hypothetical protein